MAGSQSSGGDGKRPIGLGWRSHTLFIITTVGIGLFTDLFLYGLGTFPPPGTCFEQCCTDSRLSRTDSTLHPQSESLPSMLTNNLSLTPR